MYAVIDTETTGLSPGWKHRILEVAVVLTDSMGQVQQEWCTVVNAERDLGPQHIHGINAADVAAAPRFEDFAGYLLKLLEGRALVAHNLPFDAMFLKSEYERLGVEFPVTADLGLCTMNWSKVFLPGVGRSLKECCVASGTALNGWHSALSDARATADLLRYFLNAATSTSALDQWEEFPPATLLRNVERLRWPVLPPRTFESKIRATTHPPDAGTLVAELTDYMPRVDSSELADPYLAVLDEALADRYLSREENAMLLALAGSLGLGPQETTRLHHDYLDALARVALSDRHLSEQEEADLRQVADVLGLPESAADDALKQAGVQISRGDDSPPIAHGDMIVFTGDMDESREVWEQRAREHGYVPHPNVTKKVKLVVAADPNSLSGKAKKARGYGIPIIGTGEFRTILDAQNQDRSGAITGRYENKCPNREDVL